LEGVLLSHASVQDAAVVGIRDDFSGELPRAFVVLHEGIPKSENTKDALISFVKSKCTRAKWLDGGLMFLDTIPKSASGKILRRLLRDQSKEDPRKVRARL
jgi:acyl-coenzyme A synthetase/AMP-(fatty) acid ligase